VNPLTPYMLLIKIVAAISLLGGIIWSINAFLDYEQKIGYDRRVAEDNIALIAATATARTTERALNKKLETARDDATAREIKLQTTAAAAGTAAAGLRNALNTIRSSLPDNPASPSPEPARTLAELLGNCAEDYRGVAEKADRHSSDARTVIEAWPAAK